MDFRWQRLGNATITGSLHCAAGLSDSILPPCSLAFSPLFHIFPFSLCHFPVKRFNPNRLRFPLEIIGAHQDHCGWLTDWLTDWKDLDPDSPFERFGAHESDKWRAKSPLQCASSPTFYRELWWGWEGDWHTFTVFDRPQETTEITGVPKVYLPYREQNRAVKTYKK